MRFVGSCAHVLPVLLICSFCESIWSLGGGRRGADGDV